MSQAHRLQRGFVAKGDVQLWILALTSILEINLARSRTIKLFLERFIYAGLAWIRARRTSASRFCVDKGCDRILLFPSNPHYSLFVIHCERPWGCRDLFPDQLRVLPSIEHAEQDRAVR